VTEGSEAMPVLKGDYLRAIFLKRIGLRWVVLITIQNVDC